MKYSPKQGDIIWLNFTPSTGKEMRGKHPAVVISSNAYNKKTSYIIVCPITSKGNEFGGYLPLNGYSIHGRINTIQIHSFDTQRIVSNEFIDRLRPEDILAVKQMIDFALDLDF